MRKLNLKKEGKITKQQNSNCPKFSLQTLVESTRSVFHLKSLRRSDWKRWPAAPNLFYTWCLGTAFIQKWEKRLQISTIVNKLLDQPKCKVNTTQKIKSMHEQFKILQKRHLIFLANDFLQTFYVQIEIYWKKKYAFLNFNSTIPSTNISLLNDVSFSMFSFFSFSFQIYITVLNIFFFLVFILNYIFYFLFYCFFFMYNCCVCFLYLQTFFCCYFNFCILNFFLIELIVVIIMTFKKQLSLQWSTFVFKSYW